MPRKIGKSEHGDFGHWFIAVFNSSFLVPENGRNEYSAEDTADRHEGLILSKQQPLVVLCSAPPVIAWVGYLTRPSQEMVFTPLLPKPVIPGPGS